jgi:hypothetical protein
MGTYEKSYCVDGEEYELYRQTDFFGRFIGYQLVTHHGEPVGDGLLERVPRRLDVVALVRERRRREQGVD